MVRLGLRGVDRAQTTVRAHAPSVLSLANLDTPPSTVTRRLALVIQGHTILPAVTCLGGAPRKERDEQRRRQDGKREKLS